MTAGRDSLLRSQIRHPRRRGRWRSEGRARCSTEVRPTPEVVPAADGRLAPEARDVPRRIWFGRGGAYGVGVRVVVCAALVAGVVLRIWVLRSPLGDVDLDEAASGLQARAFLDGRPAVFFPGQAYGGTAETGLIAIAFTIIGDGVIALKLVPLLLQLVAVVVVWRTACRLRDDVLGQLVPPILLWVGSPFGVWWSTKARGFYGVAVVVAAVVLLLVVRLQQEGRRTDVALLGLVLGVGFWTTPLVAAAAGPPVLWLAVRRPGLWRHAPVAAGAAVVGSLPSLVWNATNGWSSFHPPINFGSTWAQRFADWAEGLAAILGFATPFDTDRDLVPRAAVIALVLAVVVAATWTTRRSAPGLVAGGILGYGVIHSFYGLPAFAAADPRYLYPLLPLLALAVGLSLPSQPRGWEGHAPIALSGVVLAGLALAAWGLVGMRAAAERDTPNHFLASPGLDEVLDLLDQRGIDAVTTDVVGHQISFLSDGEVVASTYAVVRFPDLEREAAERGRCTYVFRRGTRAGGRAALDAHLQEADIDNTRIELGTFTVFLLGVPVDPADVPLVSLAGPARPVGGASPAPTC